MNYEDFSKRVHETKNRIHKTEFPYGHLNNFMNEYFSEFNLVEPEMLGQMAVELLN